MVLLTDLVNAAFALSSGVGDPASVDTRNALARRDVKYLPRFANDAVQLHHTVKVAKGVVQARDTEAVQVPVSELVDILSKLHSLEKQVAALLPSGRLPDDKKAAANGEECDVEHLLYYLGVNGTDSKPDQVRDHPLFRRNANCTMDAVAAEQQSGKNSGKNAAANTAANTPAGSGDEPASASASPDSKDGQASHGSPSSNANPLTRPTSPADRPDKANDGPSGAILIESPDATDAGGSKKAAVNDIATPVTKAPQDAEPTEATNTLDNVYTTTLEEVATDLDGNVKTTTVTRTMTNRVTVTISRKLTVAIAASPTDAAHEDASPAKNSTKIAGDATKAAGDAGPNADTEQAAPGQDVTAAPSPSLKVPVPVGANQQYTNSTVTNQDVEPETPAAESTPEETTRLLMGTGDLPSGFKTISTPAAKAEAAETTQ